MPGGVMTVLIDGFKLVGSAGMGDREKGAIGKE